MAGLTRINRIMPIDQPLQSLPRHVQRAYEQADKEWRDGKFLVRDRRDGRVYTRTAGLDEEGTQFYSDTLHARAAEIAKAIAPPTPARSQPAPRSPGRVTQRYNDGSCLVELDEDAQDEYRKQYRGEEEKLSDEGFRPYGSNGSKIQGVQLAEYVDPQGLKYGNPKNFPDAHKRNFDSRLAERRARGIPDNMPDAQMDNRGHQLKFSPEVARLESGRPAYGNPKSFGSRDDWRTPFRGGYSLGPNGNTKR